MNCPECGKEMERGHLHGKWPLLWSAKEKKKLLIRTKNEVELFRGVSPEAHLCRDCQAVIVKYE